MDSLVRVSISDTSDQNIVSMKFWKDVNAGATYYELVLNYTPGASIAILFQKWVDTTKNVFWYVYKS